MNDYIFNGIQSLLFSYITTFHVDSDKIACPCVDFLSGFAIITVWNSNGVPINTVIEFDPDELDENEEGLCCINVDKVPIHSVGDYDSAFKCLVLLCSEKMSSIISIGYSCSLRVYDVDSFLDGKVVFTRLYEGL